MRRLNCLIHHSTLRVCTKHRWLVAGYALLGIVMPLVLLSSNWASPRLMPWSAHRLEPNKHQKQPRLTGRLQLLGQEVGSPKRRLARPAEVAVVVMTSQRPEVQLLLHQLLAYRPHAGFRIFVSQDGQEAITAGALAQFDGAAVTRLRFSADRVENDSYARIAVHHLLALNYVFLDLEFRHAIVLEDDLLVAPDFYSYFGALRTVLDTDPSVFCVSAWNDNGLAGLVKDDAIQLHRTDFFPGLGWMIGRSTWLALRKVWPGERFDDFLRKFMRLRGLVCVRPELSRTFNTGRHGGRDPGACDIYGRSFYHNYLSRMVLNMNNVIIPLSSIRSVTGRSAEVELQRKAEGAPVMELDSLLTAPVPPEAARLRYRTADEFVSLAWRIGIIPEVWFGTPRASLRGIVTVRIRGCEVFIVPDSQLPVSEVVVKRQMAGQNPGELSKCH